MSAAAAAAAWWGGLLVCAPLLAGCGARSPLRCVDRARPDDASVTPPDAPDARDDADARRPDAAPAPDAACAELLRVRSVDVPPTCIVDVRVGREAVLRFPCGGGAATAVFDGDAGEVYSGTVAAGRVDLLLQTRFLPGDGCEWQTTQRIRGDLTSGALTYTYEESPVPPGRTGCLPPCPLTTGALIARPVDPTALDAGATPDEPARPRCEP